MSEFSTFLQIALPCLQYSSRIALDQKPPEQLKKDIEVLVQGASGRIGPDCETIARRYFGNPRMLQGDDFGQDPFTYFFKTHHENMVEVSRIIPRYAHYCTARLVEVKDKKAVDLKTGEEVDYKLVFTPGAYMRDYVKHVPYVIDSLGPRVVMLDEQRRTEMQKYLTALSFEVGPLVKSEPGYYVWHWGVLCHKLDAAEVETVKKLL